MAKYKLMSLQINIPGESVITYIEKRYYRFLDYATYHSYKAGIPELAHDLLNEVLLNTLEKDTELLNKLYSTKKGRYTELDFFVLKLIKINAHSKLSPFRWKYRSRNIDTEIKIDRLKIVEEPDEEIDKSEVLLKQMRLVRWIFFGLDLTDFEKAVFEHRFINDESFNDWPGPENYRKLNSTYHRVSEIIHHVLYFYGFTKVAPKLKFRNRQSEIADRFVKTHKINKLITIKN